MKMNLKKLGNLMILGLLIIAIAGCKKLPLQDKFEFNSEVAELTPYKGLTALQFLQLDPKNEFNYMRQVIKLTGMEAEYSVDMTKRTYLLLKDTAFVDGYPNGSGVNQYTGVTKDLTGVNKGDLSKVNVDRLKKLLNYHIINEYVDQFSPLLPKRQVEFFFQSLVPGVEGTISIRRTEFYGFNFNTSSTIPTGTAGKKTTNRVQHGYVFKNGIAHLLSNYIRYKPF